jgi:hypothetical protein
VKKGDLVKVKPEAAEGDPESVGIGVIIKEGADDWNKEFVYVEWLRHPGKPWFRYKDDLELISEKERSTGSRGSS